ncbi:MAG: sulfite exporter TauE/SafE family protein, partial [Acidobacteriota bacterium]
MERIRDPGAGADTSWNAEFTPAHRRMAEIMETLLGFAIAVMVGLTGVGGGSLTVPILILTFGMPAVSAVGTSLLFVTACKLVAGP